MVEATTILDQVACLSGRHAAGKALADLEVNGRVALYRCLHCREPFGSRFPKGWTDDREIQDVSVEEAQRLLKEASESPRRHRAAYAYGIYDETGMTREATRR